MRRLILSFSFLFMSVQFALADQVTLNWNIAAGVSGYKVYKSIDKGVTWVFVVDAPTNSIIITVEGDKLVLIKVTTMVGTLETPNNWRGAWYDGTKRIGVAGMSAD